MKHNFKYYTMYYLFLFTLLFTLNCFQNITKCPLDTFMMKIECEVTKEETQNKNQTLLGIVAIT